MKLKITLSFALIMFYFSVYSDNGDDTLQIWNYGGIFHSGFSQVGLKNWAGGGENSLTLNGMVNIFANMERESSIWENQFELGYGLNRQGKADAPFKKSDDRILLVSKYSRKINEKSAITAIMDFRTQIDKGYRYYLDENEIEQKELTSTFMSPAYLMFALGYEYRPVEDVYFIISPVSTKSTIVLDDEIAASDNFGMEEGEKFMTEIGVSFISFAKLQLMENMEFQNRLFLFAPYEQIDKIDVNWETMLIFHINKILQLNISTQLIYDENVIITRDDETVGPAVQFKHIMSLGLTWQFNNKDE